MNTLFLHGFNSGPVNHSDDWLTIQLDYSNVDSTVERLTKFIKENDVKYIVGKSIGAYFALVLYHIDPTLTIFMINPSLEPYKTLKAVNGKTMKNYRDESIQTNVPVDFTDKLRAINPVGFESVHFNGGLFLELGDEVVNQVDNETRIKCMFKIVYEGGTHSFTPEHMEQVVKHINTFISYDFI